MLVGERVTLRAMRREDLPRLWEFNNDLEVELAGGGDPPMPQSFDRLVADWEREAAKGGRDDSWFAIEVDGEFIGQCGLMHVNETARTAELGIGIGDKRYWGRGYGREAVNLLLEYAFRYRNYRRVWLWVHGDNERGDPIIHRLRLRRGGPVARARLLERAIRGCGVYGGTAGLNGSGIGNRTGRIRLSIHHQSPNVR